MMNEQTGWLRFYKAYWTRNWSVESYKAYQRARDKLFNLAVHMSMTKKRQRKEGLLNGSGQRTARGQFWIDTLRSGFVPTMEQLNAAAEAAAVEAARHQPPPKANCAHMHQKNCLI